MHQPQGQRVPQFKLVIVGDTGCGKTSLLGFLARGRFPESYIPRIFESHVEEFQLHGGERVGLALWDTIAEEEDDRLRPLAYHKAHIILLCYAVNDEQSLHNAQEKWIAEVSQFAPHVPRFLVGCKTDLREDGQVLDDGTGVRMLTPEDGSKVASKLNAEFFECSAKRGDGVRNVFEHAARAAFSYASDVKKESRCTIL